MYQRVTGAPAAVQSYVKSCRNFVSDYENGQKTHKNLVVSPGMSLLNAGMGAASLGGAAWEAKKLWGFTGATVGGVKIPATLGKVGALHSIGVSHTASGGLQGALCAHGKLFGCLGAATPVGHIAAVALLGAAGLYAGFNAVQWMRRRSLLKEYEKSLTESREEYLKALKVQENADKILSGQITLSETLYGKAPEPELIQAAYPPYSMQSQPVYPQQNFYQTGEYAPMQQPQTYAQPAQRFSATDLYTPRQQAQPARPAAAPRPQQAANNGLKLEIDNWMSAKNYSENDVANALREAATLNR